ncbi:MAG: peptide chain release factor N(5)-glutamine methyltransferase [Acholeplasmatales bacterium]|nr:peptide chain release factor N(5)-glutamine methyltransferase [Acholeplasmatales bacterium]
MTYKELYEKAKMEANKLNKEESAVLILLLHFCKKSSANLYANMNDIVDEDVLKSFNEAINRYFYDNVPVQHITGIQEFYGYEFNVDNNVLIPRPETEELVENILLTYDELMDYEVKVVDIGCGSGCIGLTLKLEEPRMDLTLTDISHEAVLKAEENAKKLGADVKFLEGDMLKPLKGLKFDILVSNPPYIPTNEEIQDLVKDNEPWVALFGGEDGLKFYRIILSEAKSYLKGRSMIAFEHGFDKREAIRELALKYFPNAEVRQFKDIFGKDRMTIVINKQIDDNELIIFPTDTVYGLGAKVFDNSAQEKIMEIKNRDCSKRFAVLCANLSQIEELAYVSEDAKKIINKFLPGGLTLILKAKNKDIHNYAIDDTVAVRIPKHPIALKVLLENGPLATTSVNLSGCKPMNDYTEINKVFKDKVDYILSDPTNITYSNVPSTIIDMTNGLKVIREGEITLEDILKVIS